MQQWLGAARAPGRGKGNRTVNMDDMTGEQVARMFLDVWAEMERRGDPMLAAILARPDLIEVRGWALEVLESVGINKSQRRWPKRSSRSGLASSA